MMYTAFTTGYMNALVLVLGFVLYLIFIIIFSY